MEEGEVIEFLQDVKLEEPDPESLDQEMAPDDIEVPNIYMEDSPAQPIKAYTKKGEELVELRFRIVDDSRHHQARIEVERPIVYQAAYREVPPQLDTSIMQKLTNRLYSFASGESLRVAFAGEGNGIKWKRKATDVTFERSLEGRILREMNLARANSEVREQVGILEKMSRDERMEFLKDVESIYLRNPQIIESPYKTVDWLVLVGPHTNISKHEKVLVGYSQLVPEEEELRIIEDNGFGINPGIRRHGAGGKLLREIEDVARQKGKKKVYGIAIDHSTYHTRNWDMFLWPQIPWEKARKFFEEHDWYVDSYHSSMHGEFGREIALREDS